MARRPRERGKHPMYVEREARLEPGRTFSTFGRSIESKESVAAEVSERASGERVQLCKPLAAPCDGFHDYAAACAKVNLAIIDSRGANRGLETSIMSDCGINFRSFWQLQFMHDANKSRRANFHLHHL